MVIIKAIGSDRIGKAWIASDRSAILPASLRWSRNNKMTSNTSCDPRGTNTQAKAQSSRPYPHTCVPRRFPYSEPLILIQIVVLVPLLPLPTPCHASRSSPQSVPNIFHIKNLIFFPLAHNKTFSACFSFHFLRDAGVAEGRAVLGGEGGRQQRTWPPHKGRSRRKDLSAFK